MDIAGEFKSSHLDIRSILHQRGKVVTSIGEPSHTFLKHWSKKPNPGFDLYDYFNDKKNREAIRGQILAELDVEFNPNFKVAYEQTNMNVYSQTLEWYVSEILKREFSFLSSGFGIKLEHSPDGGDFDVVGMSHFDFVYIECKSGKPKNIDENDIASFIERAKFLNATVSIFYVDYKGIQKEFKFNIDRFKYINKGNPPESIWSFRNTKRCSKVLRTSHHPIYIIDSNTAEETVNDNIRSVLDIHHSIQAIRGSRLSTEFKRVESRGYHVQKI